MKEHDMQILATNTEIQATEIQRGMVVRIYGGTEKVTVERVVNRGFGAVEVFDGIRWYGLSETERVQVAGYYNP
jgi:hypothetical protein